MTGRNIVFVVGGMSTYYRPFASLGRYSADFDDLLHRPGEIRMVVFCGGEDVSPAVYGHPKSNRSYCNSDRDRSEIHAFRHARKNGLPMAGICRGAQFLCAMAGGTLYQHVTGHGFGTHGMSLWDGREISVNSLHHQMQRPPDDAKVLGWSKNRLSNIYVGDGDYCLPEPEYEVECAYYPSIRAIGMQHHPETMSNDSEGFSIALELVEKFILPESPTV